MAGAAGYEALTVFTADEEGTLFEAGDDGNAGGVHGDAIWNAAIGGCHEFVEHCVGRFDTIIEFGGVSSVGVRADEGGKQDEGQ